MKKVFFLVVLALLSQADTNTTKNVSDKNSTKPVKKVIKKDANATASTSKEKILKEQLKKQMELEAKYAKEQRFYQGSEYNLKEKEVDEKVLEHVPSIEPDYDFDITDVYADEQ